MPTSAPTRRATRYNSLITDISSTTSNLRAYQAPAQDRAKGSNHAIFKGEAGVWRDVLVKKMDHSHRPAEGKRLVIPS